MTKLDWEISYLSFFLIHVCQFNQLQTGNHPGGECICTELMTFCFAPLPYMMRYHSCLHSNDISVCITSNLDMI